VPTLPRLAHAAAPSCLHRHLAPPSSDTAEHQLQIREEPHPSLLQPPNVAVPRLPRTPPRRCRPVEGSACSSSSTATTRRSPHRLQERETTSRSPHARPTHDVVPRRKGPPAPCSSSSTSAPHEVHTASCMNGKQPVQPSPHGSELDWQTKSRPSLLTVVPLALAGRSCVGPRPGSPPRAPHA
jgi:hypothetical protein